MGSILKTLRRRLTTVALAAVAGPILVGSAAVPSQERYEFSGAVMGSEFRLVFYHHARSSAEMAAREAFERLEELDGLLSDYRSDSEISSLASSAGSGVLVSVSADTWAVLNEADEVARGTAGAFDVTIGSLTRLWRWASRRGQLPDPGRIATAQATVGYGSLELVEGERVRLGRAGTRLDLGGLAKGYAVDQAFEVLKAHGIERALVDGGGDLRLGEPPPDAPGWRVSVPRQGSNGELDQHTRVLSRTAIATSGPSKRSLIVDGLRYSHVIDPRTGQGVTTDRWVTVLAASAMRADAIASALSVLGDPGRAAATALGAVEASVLEPTPDSNRVGSSRFARTPGG